MNKFSFYEASNKFMEHEGQYDFEAVVDGWMDGYCFYVHKNEGQTLLVRKDKLLQNLSSS